MQALLRFGRVFFLFPLQIQQKLAQNIHGKREVNFVQMKGDIPISEWRYYRITENAMFTFENVRMSRSPGIRVRRGPQYLLLVLKGTVHLMRPKKNPMFRVTARSLPDQRPSKGNLVKPFSSNGNGSLEGKIVKGDVKR